MTLTPKTRKIHSPYINTFTFLLLISLFFLLFVHFFSWLFDSFFFFPFLSHL